MTIRKIERYRGGSASEITRFAALGRAKNLALGAISYSVARIHTGEHAGKWLAEIAYHDWAAYGRITEALAADAQWQKDMAGWRYWARWSSACWWSNSISEVSSSQQCGSGYTAASSVAAR